jgi:hypothetical protein
MTIVGDNAPLLGMPTRGLQLGEEAIGENRGRDARSPFAASRQFAQVPRMADDNQRPQCKA